MIKFLLVLAAIADLAIAVLLIAVSGFLFGSGPESMRGGPLAVAVFSVAVIGCVALPAVSFVMNSRGKTGLALLAAWLPVAGALVATTFPAPY